VNAGTDFVLPFDVGHLGLRGRLVRLGPVLDRVLGQHDYPEAVSTLLAETMAISAALASILKIEGVFTLQAQGDGAVSTLVCDVAHPGAMRGYAKFDAARVAKRMAFRPDGPLGPVRRLLGAGHLAFTLDQGPDTERYQGVVALDGSTVAECVDLYFRDSEQIATLFRTAVRRIDGAWHAGALMIQKVPGASPPEAANDFDAVPLDADAAEEEAWREAIALAATATEEELAGPATSAATTVDRLFRLAGVESFEPQPLAFGCRCSRERVNAVLRSFPAEEIGQMVNPDGRIEAKCEFCSSVYGFLPEEIAGPGTNAPA